MMTIEEIVTTYEREFRDEVTDEWVMSSATYAEVLEELADRVLGNGGGKPYLLGLPVVIVESAEGLKVRHR